MCIENVSQNAWKIYVSQEEVWYYTTLCAGGCGARWFLAAAGTFDIPTFAFSTDGHTHTHWLLYYTRFVHVRIAFYIICVMYGATLGIDEYTSAILLYTSPRSFANKSTALAPWNPNRNSARCNPTFIIIIIFLLTENLI